MYLLSKLVNNISQFVQSGEFPTSQCLSRFTTHCKCPGIVTFVLFLDASYRDKEKKTATTRRYA